MRKGILILSISTFLFLYGFSQPSFPNDTSYKSYESHLEKQFDSIFHLEKNNDFEFRFKAHYWKPHRTDLIILALKDDKWHIRFIEYGYEPYQDSLVKPYMKERMPSEDADMHVLLKKIQANHYLTIRKDDLLRDKKGKPLDLVILDGYSFFFDLVSTKNKRSYYYRCPKYFSTQYPGVKEFKNVVEIIKALYEYFGIERPIC